MKKYTSLLLITLILFICSCHKKEDPILLLIETSPYEIQGDSIKLVGEIISLSNDKIIEFGFVMDKSQMPGYNTADSIFLINQTPQLGVFSHSIINSIEKETIFNIRFFAKTISDFFYGDTIVLHGNGKIVPVLTEFAPKIGLDGDLVKIYGKYFRSGNYIEIYLGDERLELIEWKDESLLVKIPDYHFREELAFKIILNEHTIVSDELFLLQGPYIKSFAPTSGGDLIEIMIYGENFSKIPWHNHVTIGNVKADVIESTDEQLKIKLDTRSIAAGNYHFMINSEGKFAFSGSVFEVISPWAYDSQIPVEEGLAYPVTLSYDNKIYIITGTTNWLSSAGHSQFVFEYDLQTQSWSQRNNFPGERRSGAAGFVINGKGYIGTGWGGDSHTGLTDFWEYDFQFNKWTYKNDFPGSKRSGVHAFIYNENGYFLMGGHTADFWKYNHQDDSWLQLPSFEGDKDARALHLIIEDDLYVVTLGVEENPYEGEIWKFNFLNNQWSFVNILYDFPLKIFRFNEKTYILKTLTNTVFDVTQTILYEFDIEQGRIINQFETFPGQNRSRSSFAIIQNDQLYFGCGGTGGFGDCLNDVWIYPLYKINK